MITKILCVLFLIIVISRNRAFGQVISRDTAKVHTSLVHKIRPLIIPATLIGYGIVGLENHYLQDYDREIKEELNEYTTKRVTIDDFSQYAPSLSVYALNALGIKGKNNFRDRSVILATSYLIMSTSISSIKSIAHVERPDSTSNNSFPSGHTATAFMGAEFLWQEYKDVSVWYGIAGYAVAAGTGFYRMYNNRHWLTDVAAGAGIGILSTKIAYWVNPFIKQKLFGKKKDNVSAAVLCPYYNGKQTGVNFAMSF